MILVEGADMVGKTTLCRRLVRDLHKLKVPVAYRAFGLLPQGWDYYRDYLPHVQRPVVMDRFHLSEIAYATAARGGQTGLDSERFRLLEAQLTLVGCVRVLITAEDAYLEAAHPKHFPREEFDLDTIKRANAAFETANRVRGGQREWADVHYRVTWPKPAMPSDSLPLVESVIDLWRYRQDLLNLTREARVWT